MYESFVEEYERSDSGNSVTAAGIFDLLSLSLLSEPFQEYLLRIELTPLHL